jgi:DNA modification methylase
LFDETQIEGVDGTFAEAKFEPFHSWYTYLEGYSPAFVEGIRAKYLPKASTILEPFAGSGTTPFTLATRGVRCGYSEVNPVMRWVISSKLAVAGLGTGERRRLADRLDVTADGLAARIERAEPDQTLRASYTDCFGESVFFSAEAFRKVLGLRAVTDELDQDDPLLSRLLVIAAMAQIVNCSLLKRAGDVRYRTKAELDKGVPDFVLSVAEHVRRIARDTRNAPTLNAVPWLVTPNAKHLRATPAVNADGVITSPPYLNGTNYIRNTKLELWFSRLMKTSADLRALRDQVVTSGINDVAGSSMGDDELPPGVASVVAKIRKSAYDQRIPEMVAQYFRDMGTVLEGLARQTVPGATICIDIGDSRYGGVHVPTHDLLVEVAAQHGMHVVERLPLRKRLSKDKSVLTQEVLVFERPRKAKVIAMPGAALWRRRWEWFKAELPHQQSPYTARNWGHPLHSACSYLGKMKPALAHFLVHCFSEPGQQVLDPFSGAGTIPFEAALSGRRSAAVDISLLAASVSSAKLCPPPQDALYRLLSEFDAYLLSNKPTRSEIQNASMIRFNGALDAYFHERTFREVLVARRFFLETRQDSHEWRFLLTCMMHVLHGNRPYAVSRRSHPVTPFAPTGPAEYRSVAEKVRAKVDRSIQAVLPDEFVAGRVYQADLLEPWPKEIGGIDAIITSPPFFDSTRFYMSNWMRFWFAGWERETFDIEPARFVETLQKRSMQVYAQIFESCRSVLSPHGVVVLHLGKSRKCDMGAALAAIAPNAGLKVEEIFSEDVGHCESHGVRDKGTVTAHQYLVMTRA